MRRNTFQIAIFLIIVFSLFLSLGLSPAWSQEKGKPIVIGAPVPRASAYGQNGERG